MSQFRKIPFIPTADKLIDMVFSKLKKIRVDTPRKIKMKRSDLSFYKTLYFRQFRFIFPEFDTKLLAIASSFPFIDDLHPFHKELIEVLFGIERIRTSISRVKNTRKSLRSIERDVSKKLGKCETAEEAKKIRREALGRISSTIEKLDEPLNDLIRAKIELSKVPDFNLNEKTIAFAGAPNAGKSSYVKIVSTGKPEIAAYPFTTKELICGHRKHGFEAIQLIDTPGLLDRPLQERNEIEMRSILALKHLTDYIIFLFDPTEDAPLTVQQQLNLCNEITETFSDIPMMKLINKKDVLTKTQIDAAKNLLGELEAIATIDSNKKHLEEIVLAVAEKIPEKKLFVKPDELKKVVETTHKANKKDKIEWIFFDEND